MKAHEMNTNVPLVFQNTTFDVIDHNGDAWLRLPQIGVALGYDNPYKVQQLYSRHADEFTEDMTALVKLPTEGGEQEVRIFSPRGCYALAMFARTKPAKAFRKWTLDVLESIRKTGRYEIPATKKALPGKLTAESQDLVKKAFRERVEERPQEKWGVASRLLWGAIGSKFGTRGTKDGYKNIPNEALSEIMSLIARTPLPGDPIEGEYMPAANDPQTLNDTIARMTQQVESGNGTPVDVFLPLLMAVVKKRPELLSEFVTEEQLTRAAVKQLQATRFTVQFGASDYFGSEASPIMVPIAKGAQTFKPQDVINEIASNRSRFFKDDHIKEIICAIGTRLKTAA